MIRKATPATANYRPADSYLAQIKRFPLRPLRGKEEYRVAVETLGRLATLAEPDEGERDYMAGLSRFVGDYEEHGFRWLAEKMSPLEALKHLMAEHEMSTTDLGYVLGSRGIASEVLNGKRGLSKALIGRLAAKFSVDPGIFLERVEQPAKSGKR